MPWVPLRTTDCWSSLAAQCYFLSYCRLTADDAASLRKILKTHKDQLARPDTLWVAYPKGNRADINRDSVWPILGEYGMRPIGQASVDDVWSAMRFRPNRKGEAPFTGGR